VHLVFLANSFVLLYVLLLCRQQVHAILPIAQLIMLISNLDK
jgi:hypothetical protein